MMKSVLPSVKSKKRSHQRKADRLRKAFKRLDRVYKYLEAKATEHVSDLQLIQNHRNNFRQLKFDFGLIWSPNLDSSLSDLIEDYINRIFIHRKNLRDCCLTFGFQLPGKFRAWIFPRQ